jgi:hypothetical protein
MISASPPGHKRVAREGVEPSRPFGHGLLRPACPTNFTTWPSEEQWTVEGVEPSSAGCKPAVFPLDDTPRIETVAPVGLEPTSFRLRGGCSAG